MIGLLVLHVCTTGNIVSVIHIMKKENEQEEGKISY